MRKRKLRTKTIGSDKTSADPSSQQTAVVETGKMAESSMEPFPNKVAGSLSARPSQKRRREESDLSLKSGNVVWAKMPGYPWWPGLIHMHPTTHSHLKMVGSIQQVHVWFYSTPPTRAWLRASFVKPFTDPRGFHIGRRYIKTSFKCCQNAQDAFQALSVPLERRLHLLSPVDATELDSWLHQQGAASDNSEASGAVAIRQEPFLISEPVMARSRKLGSISGETHKPDILPRITRASVKQHHVRAPQSAESSKSRQQETGHEELTAAAEASPSRGTTVCPFRAGDVVWAKVLGHPWWPGLVFPKAGPSSFVRTLRRELQIYIAFYSDPLTQSWIPEKFVKQFVTSSGVACGGRWFACGATCRHHAEHAQRALELSAKDRLAEYVELGGIEYQKCSEDESTPLPQPLSEQDPERRPLPASSSPTNTDLKRPSTPWNASPTPQEQKMSSSPARKRLKAKAPVQRDGPNSPQLSKSLVKELSSPSFQPTHGDKQAQSPPSKPSTTTRASPDVAGPSPSVQVEESRTVLAAGSGTVPISVSTVSLEGAKLQNEPSKVIPVGEAEPTGPVGRPEPKTKKTKKRRTKTERMNRWMCGAGRNKEDCPRLQYQLASKRNARRFDHQVHSGEYDKARRGRGKKCMKVQFKPWRPKTKGEKQRERELKKRREKANMLSFLKTERHVLHIIINIRESLCAGKRNEEHCKNLLTELQGLSIPRVVLLKNPDVAYTISDLLSYTEESVKEKAAQVWQQFEAMFGVPDSQSFLEVFCRAAFEFKENDKKNRAIYKRYLQRDLSDDSDTDVSKLDKSRSGDENCDKAKSEGATEAKDSDRLAEGGQKSNEPSEEVKESIGLDEGTEGLKGLCEGPKETNSANEGIMCKPDTILVRPKEKDLICAEMSTDDGKLPAPEGAIQEHPTPAPEAGDLDKCADSYGSMEALFDRVAEVLRGPHNSEEISVEEIVEGLPTGQETASETCKSGLKSQLFPVESDAKKTVPGGQESRFHDQPGTRASIQSPRTKTKPPHARENKGALYVDTHGAGDHCSGGPEAKPSCSGNHLSEMKRSEKADPLNSEPHGALSKRKKHAPRFKAPSKCAVPADSEVGHAQEEAERNRSCPPVAEASGGIKGIHNRQENCDCSDGDSWIHTSPGIEKLVVASPKTRPLRKHPASTLKASLQDNTHRLLASPVAELMAQQEKFQEGLITELNDILGKSASILTMCATIILNTEDITDPAMEMAIREEDVNSNSMDNSISSDTEGQQTTKSGKCASGQGTGAETDWRGTKAKLELVNKKLSATTERVIAFTQDLTEVTHCYLQDFAGTVTAPESSTEIHTNESAERNGIPGDQRDWRKGLSWNRTTAPQQPSRSVNPDPTGLSTPNTDMSEKLAEMRSKPKLLSSVFRSFSRVIRGTMGFHTKEKKSRSRRLRKSGYRETS